MSFFFFDFGTIFTKDANEISFRVTGLKMNNQDFNQNYSTLPLLIIFIIINAITLISIFLFKKRMLQIRLNVFNFISQLGSVGICFYYLNNATSKFGVDYKTSIIIVLPIVAAILTFLAIRAIARDEALVQSLNRLR